jgi:hypothetical protein
VESARGLGPLAQRLAARGQQVDDVLQQPGHDQDCGVRGDRQQLAVAKALVYAVR